MLTWSGQIHPSSLPFWIQDQLMRDFNHISRSHPSTTWVSVLLNRYHIVFAWVWWTAAASPHLSRAYSASGTWLECNSSQEASLTARLGSVPFSGLGCLAVLLPTDCELGGQSIWATLKPAGYPTRKGFTPSLIKQADLRAVTKANEKLWLSLPLIQEAKIQIAWVGVELQGSHDSGAEEECVSFVRGIGATDLSLMGS